MSEPIRLTDFSHGGGCACKLDMRELGEILRHTQGGSPTDRLIVALDSPDDAAVFELSADHALVQTVDFFTPIVDDPFDWGRIAAANALSDVYAMGGRPATAMNLVAWPRSLGFDLLKDVLAGGHVVCEEAGVAIVGGHSVDDPEPKFGMAVTGFVRPDSVVRKTTARPGDEIVLTKPLGTGIISSALKQDVAPAESVTAAVASMTRLNREAAEAMVEVEVNAATDVTGFGLVGHLSQMLNASMAAEIAAEAVPILPHAEQLALAGVIPGGTRRNREALTEVVSVSGVRDGLREVLFDAQTSGGLLIAVDPVRTHDLLVALKERGVDSASRIGRFVGGEARITVIDE